ncbi:baseplate J-like family protein [[Clostridium] bifermentans ATCC 638]|uniref:Baseplate J-like family protein n=1 Tax=Paraclostridium bifermentans ATCC 638 = DSM 14991 TaxID=1233171 RepID=T4VGK3_PARBF|nr:baseplate J/gp47 family protein [Paraclostridium bifermentans]EQK39812.1 baseplate J-like family protein [[Clostridium] bifermentans ATCC 638] [Paraclostridium bifermentans ATCC 638 = DSM 14991]
MYEESLDSIKGRMLDNLGSDLDKREGSFISDMYAPMSVELAKAYMEMDNVHSIMFVNDAFGEDLDNKANEFGVFRKLGDRAKGTLRFVGINDTLIPRNMDVFTDGGYKFITTSQAYIKNGYANIEVEADLVGEVYNVEANTKWQLPFDVSVNEVVNDKAFTGGLDIENDEEFRIRFFDVVRNPRTSGNKNDYEFWAKEINGVYNAEVYPLWNGNSTVKVVASGEGRKPLNNETLQACTSYIKEKHPIGANVTVVTTTLFNISISTTITIEEAFDTETVKKAVEVSIRDYIDKCIGNIYRNKLGAKILSVEGVIDYTVLTINNKADSVIPIPSDSYCNISNIAIGVGV